MNPDDGRWPRLLLGACLGALLVGAPPLAAQDQAEAPTAEAAAQPVEILEPDEIDALVAPVVLYPDPLLALVLQAAISPLDLVEAERFLLRREQDPTLEPDPDWDASVVGLLNYPQLISSMSEYLDWTQLLGSAVVDQLDAVQVSIQGIRGAAMAQGILVSDERQKVVLVDDLIVIAPVDKTTISVPQYDPVQLLAAITPADQVIEEAPAEPVDAASVEAATVPEAPASKPEEPPPDEAAAPVEESPPAEPVPAPQAYAEPAPAPTYYAEPAPVYAAPPPAVSYGAPQSTFWSSAATFAGGAAVGGLLGYVWGDDDNDNDNDDGWDDVEDAIRDIDDDDWDDFVDRIDDDDLDDFADRLDDRDWDDARDRWGDRDGNRDINISDSNIVVGNNVKRDQLNAKLKNKRDTKLNVARGGDRAKLDLKSGTLEREGSVSVGNRAGGDRPKRPQGLAPASVKRDGRPNGPGGAANLQGAGQNRAKRQDVKLPGAGGGNLGASGQNRPQRPAAGLGQRPAQAARPAQRQEQALAAARRPGAQAQVAANRKVAAGIDQPREVRRDANRGAASKSKAGLKQGGRPQATAQRAGGGQRVAQAQPQRRAAASADRGGNRPMGGVKSGSGAKRDSNRGKQSLGKGGGGRKGGGKRGKN